MADVQISSDRVRLNVPMIHRFLTHTYWAEGRTIEQVQTTIDNSMSFGLYVDDKQVGFDRAVTDRITLAYVMDVFVLPEYRRQGYATLLMQHMLECPELAQIQKWSLKTRDGQTLYEQLGFEPSDDDNRLMVRVTS